MERIERGYPSPSRMIVQRLSTRTSDPSLRQCSISPFQNPWAMTSAAASFRRDDFSAKSPVNVAPWASLADQP